MFQKLLHFEFKYQVKQLAFPILSTLFFLIGLQLGIQGYGNGSTIYNSPQSIAEITAIMTLGSVFIIMFFTINGVIRDKRYNFESLLFTTQIKKTHYFWSRFFIVFIVSTIAFCMFFIGFFITTQLPNLDTNLVNPFNISDYLRTFFIIVLPNIFVCTSIIFSVSLLSKNNVATYASAILIYAFYFLCSLFLNSPVMANSEPLAADSYVTAALMDPFGLSALFEQTQFWTVFEKNIMPISFSGNFLWNRLLWISSGLIILLSSYGLFSFRNIETTKKKQNRKVKSNDLKVVYNPVQTKSNRIFTLITITRLEISNSIKSLPFVAVVLIWIVIVVTGIFARIFEGGPYNDSLYPATYKLIDMFINPLLVLGNILIVFYSGEIIWKERFLGFNGIVDSSPAKNSDFYFGKLLAVIFLPFGLIVVGIILSVFLQLIFDYNYYDPIMYLSLFYNPGLTFVCVGLFSVFIQSIISNKYLGMGITGLLIIFLGTSLSSLIGIEHPMLLLGNLPSINFSGMNRFNGVTKAYNYFAFYWLTFGAILGFTSYQLWQRGSINKLKFRFLLMKSTWTKKTTLSILFLFFLWISSAVVVYQNIHIETYYVSSSQKLDLKETYERNYKEFKSLKGLFPTVMNTKVDLYPSRKRYVVKGSYILKNKSTDALTKYMIIEKEPIKEISLEGANIIEHNSELGVFIFQFKEPLYPNEEVKFEYEIDKQVKGFETSRNIVKNGTYIPHRDFEPRIGYFSELEILNSTERKKRGLPEIEKEKISDDHIVTKGSRVGRIYFSTIISTEKDQTAFSSGELIKKWSENDRNYYQFDSKGLIMPTMGYFSGIYTTKIKNYKGVDIEQYYIKQNDFNINRIEESAKNTIDYCTQYFGEYPFNHIRLAQIPSYWPMGGFAHPSTISLTEDRNYLVDLRDSLSFDLVAKRITHEVAHQWFGHILAPKNVDGASLMVEGFAKYIEGRVMEKMYGKSAVWELSRNANNRYFTYRAFSNELEPPAYKVSGQGYLSYGKLYTVMLALYDLIGEEKVNSVIKTILERNKNKVSLEATTIELLEEIYKVTPVLYHNLINDWFKKIVTYDLKIKDASIYATSDGKYRIDLKIDSKRFEYLNDGSSNEIVINEPIRIGAFNKHPKEYRLNEKPIYYKHHQINKENSELTIIVDEIPMYLAIDPYGTRNDENYNDNLFECN